MSSEESMPQIMSCEYVHANKIPISKIKMSETEDVKIDSIIDSGAFTQWIAQKDEVNVDNYCDFLLKLTDVCDHYVNLDAIPGKFGTIPGPEEVERAAKLSYDNLKLMEARGLKPVPVFHQGESYKWLQRYVEEGYEFIGISPANDRTTDQRILWLDDVFEMLTNEKGEPIVRTHGLAATSPKIMRRYPWFSCDSTSWRMKGDFGNIQTPLFNDDGTYDYSDSISVTLSPKSPAVKEEGKHLDNMSERFHRMVMDYLDATGHDLEALRNDYKERNSINVKYVLGLERSLTMQPFFRPSKGFFSHKLPKVTVSKTHPFYHREPHKRMYFALVPDSNTSTVLNVNRVERRLFSYWYYGKNPERNSIDEIRNYIATGKVQESTSKRKKKQ